MEYIYAAMVLHSAEKEINEENLTEVVKAAGIDVDETRIKALVSSLEGIDVEEAIKSQQIAAPAAAPSGEAEKEEKKEKEEEEEEEEEASEEEALEGLGSLFG
ncbi:MAG: 50S ribosomal protein P1 [Euryarchaeota archaeon]|nr:50S ribosomal protein P1 [Euryarchaeota archaeon]